MEHDEEIIQKKIRAAENNPVVWNKEMVWSSISKSKNRNLTTLVFYYAAATFLFAFALVFYSVQQMKRTGFELRIKSIELAITKNTDVGKTDQIIPTEICFDNASNMKPKKLIAPKKRKELFKLADSTFYPLVSYSTLKKEPIQPLRSIADEPKQLEIQPLAETSISKIANNIEPVIGRYLSTATNLIEEKEKRLYVSLMPTYEHKQSQEKERKPFFVTRLN